jgi:hypothetical protein
MDVRTIESNSHFGSSNNIGSNSAKPRALVDSTSMSEGQKLQFLTHARSERNCKPLLFQSLRTRHRPPHPPPARSECLNLGRRFRSSSRPPIFTTGLSPCCTLSLFVRVRVIHLYDRFLYDLRSWPRLEQVNGGVKGHEDRKDGSAGPVCPFHCT